MEGLICQHIVNGPVCRRKAWQLYPDLFVAVVRELDREKVPVRSNHL
jgi:hypothetical protein